MDGTKRRKCDDDYSSKKPPFEYYTDRYYTNLKKEAREGGGDQYLAVHLNGVSISGIAETHPAVSRGKIVEVDFDVGNAKSTSRVEQAVTKGKKKRKGGLVVNESKLIAIIKNENGDTWRVHSNIAGTICELNEQLLKDPDLIRRSPTGDGWVAIIIPTRQATIDVSKEIDKQGLRKKENTEE
eukprot:TRINITY_DN17094_c0_g1_i1.p1 TRINITY_DN17094_c0_g1~~TRINITY_DN17094_c0_g1_i1.p1  ORF type:complete len:183 (+),score=38.92 TRINITY_DN17094_c0_g1_i1:75-623(+)